jgi:undecaprenyl-diphosphatase
MLSFLLQADADFLKLLNGLHHPVLDILMYGVSQLLVWLPLYAYLLWLIYKKFGLQALWVLVAVGLLIAATDQSANLFKNGFQRLRPSHQPGLMELLHYVNNYKGGNYGFFSGHASNTMAVAVFSYWLLKKQHPFIGWVVFPFTIIVSYSRIYLGVHYPIDILVGWFFGALYGWFFYKLTHYWINNRSNALH